MSDELSSQLIARLQERAKDPVNRSDLARRAANSISHEELLDSLPRSNNPGVRNYLERMNTPLAGTISNLATGDGSQAKALMGTLGKLLGNRQIFAAFDNMSVALGAEYEPSLIPEPAPEEHVAIIEKILGFSLPISLRDFYVHVANGCVGPGNGIYRLDQLPEEYRRMTTKPIGPQGQKWPANLLPISGEDFNLFLIDCDNGRLLFWDIDELNIDEDDAPDAPWDVSFKPVAGNLEDWLSNWLDR